MRNQNAFLSDDVADLSLRPMGAAERSRGRTIVIRQGSGWMPFALLAVCLLLIAVVLLGHRELAAQARRNQETVEALGRAQGKLQELESGLGFDARRRQLLLGMRDHIMRVNPRVGLADAYRYAQLALEASDKYPSVDPLLLVAIGTVESRYDPQARSTADARGLYQIWPSTGRMLWRGLGWEYDEAALYDPAKNTQAAALYLDILFSAYSDPQLVLAEYNGGPLNAGYFRAGVRALSPETRDYVPQVLTLYARLKTKFEGGDAGPVDAMYRDAHRDGKTLAGTREPSPSPRN
jgi:soluble lytic murein transglycosylase-like protein